MFQTVLPFYDSTHTKTQHYQPGMCYMNCTDTANAQHQPKASALSLPEADYIALARSILAYRRKTHQMPRPVSDTQQLTEAAAAALTALQSANHMWLDRGQQQAGCYPAASDVFALSPQQTVPGCGVNGYVQSEYSATSQNESVNGTTEDSYPLSDEEEDESRSSMDSAERRKSCILRDLQRLLKRGRSTPTQRVQRSARQDVADDAVSESGVFAVTEYSNMMEKSDDEEEEAQEFKLYRDEKDREALVRALFTEEDEEALIDRIFFSERSSAAPPTGCIEDTPGAGTGRR